MAHAGLARIQCNIVTWAYHVERGGSRPGQHSRESMWGELGLYILGLSLFHLFSFTNKPWYYVLYEAHIATTPFYATMPIQLLDSNPFPIKSKCVVFVPIIQSRRYDFLTRWSWKG